MARGLPFENVQTFRSNPEPSRIGGFHMKRATFVILATLSLAATSLMAQSKPVIKVNVPFNFVAGAKTLPAGEYQIQTERPGLLLIQSRDSKSNANLAAHSAQDTEMSGVA